MHILAYSITPLLSYGSRQLEALSMVRLRRTLIAISIGTAIMSRPASAQHGSSSSLLHTVTVTVPPRVKVQIAALVPSAAPAMRVGSVNTSTQSLSLNVSATQGWVLSIGSDASSGPRTQPVRWSLDATSGFSKLTSTHVRIASGAISTEPKAATVFFRNSVSGSSAEHEDGSAAPVLLTISAP